MKRLAKKKHNGNIFWQTYLISYSIVIFMNLVIPCKNILYRFYMYIIYLFCFLFAYLLDLMALQIFLRKTFLSVLLVTTTTMDIHLQAISKSLLSLKVFFCHTFVNCFSLNTYPIAVRPDIFCNNNLCSIFIFLCV